MIGYLQRLDMDPSGHYGPAIHYHAPETTVSVHRMIMAGRRMARAIEWAERNGSPQVVADVRAGAHERLAMLFEESDSLIIDEGKQ